MSSVKASKSSKASKTSKRKQASKEKTVREWKRMKMTDQQTQTSPSLSAASCHILPVPTLLSDSKVDVKPVDQKSAAASIAVSATTVKTDLQSVSDSTVSSLPNAPFDRQKIQMGQCAGVCSVQGPRSTNEDTYQAVPSIGGDLKQAFYGKSGNRL